MLATTLKVLSGVAGVSLYAIHHMARGSSCSAVGAGLAGLIARLPGGPVARLPGGPAALWPGCSAALLPGRPGCPTAGLPGCRAAWLPCERLAPTGATAATAARRRHAGGHSAEGCRAESTKDCSHSS